MCSLCRFLEILGVQEVKHSERHREREREIKSPRAFQDEPVKAILCWVYCLFFP